MKLLIVLGGGGHTAQMLRLANLLGSAYEYHYLVVKEVEFSRDKLTMPGAIHYVRRPRGMHDPVFASVVNSVVALAQTIIILLRVQPTAVIGCGPAISVLASAVGKLIGIRAIHVESGSRVSELSLSGQIMYSIADLFFVQWTPLKEKYPKAIYAGRL
jgi:beta-1,4-N-acetylglucosaminyltransferase